MTLSIMAGQVVRTFAMDEAHNPSAPKNSEWLLP